MFYIIILTPTVDKNKSVVCNGLFTLFIAVYMVCVFTNPKAAPMSAKGSKRTAPPANNKQTMRAGRAIMNKITAMIFVMPHVILNVSFRALKKSQINKTVIAISKIVSNINFSPFHFWFLYQSRCVWRNQDFLRFFLLT